MEFISGACCVIIAFILIAGGVCVSWMVIGANRITFLAQEFGLNPIQKAAWRVIHKWAYMRGCPSGKELDIWTAAVASRLDDMDAQSVITGEMPPIAAIRMAKAFLYNTKWRDMVPDFDE